MDGYHHINSFANADLGALRSAETTTHSEGSTSHEHLEPTSAIGEHHNTPLAVDVDAEDDGDDEDADSMPELRSLSDISDSEDEMDMASSHDDILEVEMMAFTAENDIPTVPNSQWEGDRDIFAGRPPPPLGPIPDIPRAQRRARVDSGEGDRERDRRHPSQRSAQDNSRARTWTFARTFEHIVATGASPPTAGDTPQPQQENATANPEAQGTPSQPNASTNRVPFITGIMGFGFDRDGRLVDPPSGPGFPAFTFGTPNLDEAPDPQLVAGFTQLLQAFGMTPPAPEVEDPERAKRLVDALDEVPHGLVRRMERLGGLPGAHADGTGTGAGCAICWDSLLAPEGKKFGVESTSQEAKTSSDADSSVSTPSPSPPPNTIVSLPCAHVFHASCLIPWFSRPRQATCPTCRFSIDPENLTYRRPRPPPRPAQAPPQSTAPQPSSTPSNLRTPDETNVPEPIPQAPAFAAPPGFSMNAPPVFFTGVLPMPPPPPPPSSRPRSQSQPPPRTAPPPSDGNTRPPDPRESDGIRASMRDLLGASVDVFLDALIGPGLHPPHAAPTGESAEPESNTAGTATDDVPSDANPPQTDEDADLPDDNPMQMFIREVISVDINMAMNASGPHQNSDTENTQPTADGARPPPRRPRAAFVPRRERKQWTLPPAPGPTLRERVEEQERQAGLRCFDVSCGFGPFDDDPCPTLLGTNVKQLSIKPGKGYKEGGTSVCGHTFHAGCLISAERVAGWGGGDKVRDGEKDEDEVQVACPVCRAVGFISGREWDEGVQALV